MPEFFPDTDGEVTQAGVPVGYYELDPFTQGYIAAMFFTCGNESGTLPGPNCDENGQGDDVDVGFSDLAPEALAEIINDCRRFFDSNLELIEQACKHGGYKGEYDEERAGSDFWYTRCGHGVGYWDRGLPDGIGDALSDAASKCGNVDLELGDDGKVYLL